jgi:hypothetical protein
MSRFSALLVLLVISGCAAPKHTIWDKPDGTQEGFDSDRAFCEYEALKAVQTADPAMRSMLGQELDKLNRRDEIGFACMRMKGYTARQ